MKKQLGLLTVLLLAGCAAPVADNIDVHSKKPALPKGYVLAKYSVMCPSHTRAEDAIPVDYYGPDFKADEKFRQWEYRNACRQAADGDGNGPENDEE